MKEWRYNVAVVGGGPAGMAAAVTAKKQGAQRVLLIDRNDFLGGILPQCIHDGFGLTEFKKQLTGPEYSHEWEQQLAESGADCLLNTTVVAMHPGEPVVLDVTGPECGLAKVYCGAVVLAAGCRERTLGQLRVPGSRPAGIFTAGAVQYMMNRQNLLPGRSAVILGLGDVGLIMARRLMLEGVKVKMILGQEAGGLLRNYIQCVRDFDIPLKLGYTVVSTHGNGRLKGVAIAPIDHAGKIDETQKQYVPCDTLLVAAGLIPETEIWSKTGQKLNPAGGIPVDETMSTPCPGVFACGNMVRVYDTADQVSKAGRKAGEAAAKWLKAKRPVGQCGVPEVHPGRKLTEADVAQGDQCMVCTLCPNGCVLQKKIENGVQTVVGNRCERGLGFAKQESTDPKRILTTTVRLEGSNCPLLPVRTDVPVSRNAYDAVMREVRKLHVHAPIAVGQVLLENVAHTGAKLLAAADALLGEECIYDGTR